MSAPGTYPGASTFTDGFVITPSDTLTVDQDPNNTVNKYPLVRLYVQATGNIVVSLVDSPTVFITLTGVAANTTLPFIVRQVKATGTTATVFGGIGRFHA